MLGFIEDFSCDIILDGELQLNANTGIVLNSGVDTSITLDNLLNFLPFPKINLEVYDNGKVYNNYSTSKNKSDLVSYDGNIYQCKVNNTSGVLPTDEDYWLKTNEESLILKSFIDRVKEKILTDLRLTKGLVESQYLYEVGEHEIELPGDYSAWIFEPKGSDYVTITLNEVCLQALTNDVVNLYVINQGQLIDTLELHPQNGVLSFEKLNYSFSGKGKWIFAIESQKVLTNNGYLDAHKYFGFTCYTATGIGDSLETAEWNRQSFGNGLGFNISVIKDSKNYVENNLLNLSGLIKAAFELMSLQVFLKNSNNRSNRVQQIQFNKELLMIETKEMNANTSAKRYYDELQNAKKIIQRTFDTQLIDENGLEVEIDSI